MKKVREYLVEAFKEESDPISDMNIGVRNQVINDIQKIGLTENNIKFEDDGTFFLKKDMYNYLPYHYDLSSFIDIQIKYFPFAQKVLLHNLNKSKLTIEQLIQQAIHDGLTLKQIDTIIQNSLNMPLSHNHIRYNEAKNDLTKTRIYLAKLKRTKKEEQEDDENNIYVFIGYTDKVPVMVNGKKYYEDKLVVENMIKIDKFDADQLRQVSMLKLRLRVQNYQDGAVYMLRVPKDLMDKDNYYKIPDHLYDIVDKYKKKI